MGHFRIVIWSSDTRKKSDVTFHSRVYFCRPCFFIGRKYCDIRDFDVYSINLLTQGGTVCAQRITWAPILNKYLEFSETKTNKKRIFVRKEKARNHRLIFSNGVQCHQPINVCPHFPLFFSRTAHFFVLFFTSPSNEVRMIRLSRKIMQMKMTRERLKLASGWKANHEWGEFVRFVTNIKFCNFEEEKVKISQSFVV